MPSKSLLFYYNFLTITLTPYANPIDPRWVQKQGENTGFFGWFLTKLGIFHTIVSINFDYIFSDENRRTKAELTI